MGVEICSGSVAGTASVTPTLRLPLSSHSARSRVEVAGQGLTGLGSPGDVNQGVFRGSLLALAALWTILAFVSGYIGHHDLCFFCSCNVPTSSCSFLSPFPPFSYYVGQAGFGLISSCLDLLNFRIAGMCSHVRQGLVICHHS